MPSGARNPFSLWSAASHSTAGLAFSFHRCSLTPITISHNISQPKPGRAISAQYSREEGRPENAEIISFCLLKRRNRSSGEWDT